MQLVTFSEGGNTRIGLLSNGGVVDLSKAAPDLPTDMLALIQGGETLINAAAAVDATPHYGLGEVTLLSPIPKPPKVIAIGLNYRAHAEEAGAKIPEVPLVFTKQASSVTGPYDPIYWSEEGKAMDYEGEMAIVISKDCRRVPKEKAADVILGITICNDVSVRDWQTRGTPPSFTMGKSWDSHCPLGPALVVGEGLDPHNLPIRTWVNDELRQDSNTNDLIFNCFELIEFLSTAFTLEAGAVIVTGTPSGVGVAMKPPKFLAPGDVVKVGIEGVGLIENTVTNEPADKAQFF